MQFSPTIEARFWAKVQKGNGCWNWTGSLAGNGYGSLFAGGKRHIRAHRLSYILHHGAIPDGLVVMHSCDNRRCVNPDHLSAGTQSENMLDASRKSYIDRILNVLAEIDDLGTDKKAIYKELANDGYDRTVVAQVVGHLRKKAAKPGKFAEQSQMFDLYLADYEGVGTRNATRTLHASTEPDHDPITGEIIEPHTAPSPQVVQADHGGESDDTALAAGQIQPDSEPANELPPASRGTAGEDDLREPAATVQGQNAQEGDAPLKAGANVTGEGMSGHAVHLSTDSEPGNGRAGEKPVSAGAQSTGNVDGSAGRSHSQIALSTESTASVPVDTHSIAKINAGGEDVDAAADNAGGGDSLPAVASNVLVMPAPKPLRPWCQHLDDLTKCGGYGRVHCSSCQKLKDAGAVAVPIIGSIGQ